MKQTTDGAVKLWTFISGLGTTAELPVGLEFPGFPRSLQLPQGKEEIVLLGGPWDLVATYN